MRDKAKSETGFERDLIQKIATVLNHVTLLGTLSSCAQYGPIEHLAYLQLASNCSGGGALLHAPLGSIKLWYGLGICRLIRCMVVDPMMVLVVFGRLTQTDCRP